MTARLNPKGIQENLTSPRPALGMWLNIGQFYRDHHQYYVILGRLGLE